MGINNHLKNYNPKDYDNPGHTADVLLFSMFNVAAADYRKLPEKKLNIALCMREKEPEKDKWGLPGGFIHSQNDYSLLDTAKRELKHDFGLDNIYVKELRSWSKIHRDPRHRIISNSFLAIASSDLLHTESDLENRGYETIEWFELSIEKIASNIEVNTDEDIVYIEDYHVRLVNSQRILDNTIRRKTSKHIALSRYEYETIESNDIAFDHEQMILDAYLYLKTNIEGSEIAFNFLPKLFTLTEVKQIYDEILGTELTQANFRRKIREKYGMVEETNLSTLSKRYSKNDLMRLEGAYEAFKTTASKGLWEEYCIASYELLKAYILSKQTTKMEERLSEIEGFLHDYDQINLISDLKDKIANIDLSAVDTKKQAGHRSSKYYRYNPTWDIPSDIMTNHKG